MKISRVMQFVCVSVFVAGPALASSPISLCGDQKAESAEKSEKSDTVVKTEKKSDKKESKDNKKSASKDTV
jgi:hypothetical protein